MKLIKADKFRLLSEEMLGRNRIFHPIYLVVIGHETFK